MEGWLTDAKGQWSVRFHRDPKSWATELMVIVDHGRVMTAGEPALLKTRRCMRHEDAVSLWKDLQSYGWTVAEAAW